MPQGDSIHHISSRKTGATQKPPGAEDRTAMCLSGIPGPTDAICPHWEAALPAREVGHTHHCAVAIIFSCLFPGQFHGPCPNRILPLSGIHPYWHPGI